MRDLERQCVVKQQSEKASRSAASTQARIRSSMSVALPSPPLSDASSCGSPRGRVPSLSLPEAATAHSYIHYPNISNVIQTTSTHDSTSYPSTGTDLPRSPEKIKATTVSTVSVGPPSSSFRRRSSTLTPGLLPKLSKDKDKQVAEPPSSISSMNGPRLNLQNIRGSSAQRSGPGTSVRHTHSGSNLRMSSSPHTSDVAESRGRPAHAETSPPSTSSKRQSAFVRGVSVRAGRIVKRLDSAIDFVDGKTF